MTRALTRPPSAREASATLSRTCFADLYSSGWYAHFVAGLGVQVRVFRELSAGIRAKVQRDRSFGKSEETERNLVKWGNAIGVPLVVVLFGILRWLVRRTVSRGYESRYLAEQRRRDKEAA